MHKRAFNRTVAGIIAVAFVLGGASAGQWLTTSLSPRPPMLQKTEMDLSTAHPTPNPTQAPTPKPSHTTEPNRSTVPQSAETFIVGVRDGFIAVYIDNGAEILLKETTEVPIRALPEDEQKRLLEGIHVENTAALMRVLEDYGS